MAHMERGQFSPNIEGVELDSFAFKRNFLFGVATSALQIEGAISEDGRGRTVWEKYAEERPGFIQDNAKPDMACDHYHRWREDIELMKKLGVSAYRFSISWPRIFPNGRGEINEIGWNIYPQGLYDILKRIHTEIPNIPSLVVTENGASFHDTMSPDGSVQDYRRIRYLQEHLKAVQKALKEGLPIEGYFVWSLMDNFEWRAGYKERFGVIFVDYGNHQQRTIKESGKWLSHFIS